MIPLNIWIVEDDLGYRRMLMRILNREKHITSCRAFPSCIELFEAIDAGEAQPDLVLIDLGLPVMSGVEGIKKMAHCAPNITPIVITVFDDKEKVFEALEAGAAGYLLKSSTGPEIIKGLQEVLLGGSTLSPKVAKLILEDIRQPAPSEEFNLSAREMDVLEQLAKGLAVKEIAHQLGISRSTAGTHLEKIYGKLNVQSQSGAVAKALRNGIIE